MKSNVKIIIRIGLFVILIIVILLVTLLLALLAIRYFLPHQMDDLTPNPVCEERFLERSATLMVIPLLENRSIADNPEWCDYILGLNKTLGMHGVYHTEGEFNTARNESYIRLGMEEFKKCFGFYPSIFSAPELSLSRENKKLLESMNFTVLSRPYYITHKIYHCIYWEKSWVIRLNQLNQIL